MIKIGGRFRQNGWPASSKLRGRLEQNGWPIWVKLRNTFLDPLKEDMTDKVTINDRCTEYARVFSLLEMRRIKKDLRFNVNLDDMALQKEQKYQDNQMKYTTVAGFKVYLAQKNFLQNDPKALEAAIAYQRDVLETLNP